MYVCNAYFGIVHALLNMSVHAHWDNKKKIRLNICYTWYYFMNIIGPFQLPARYTCLFFFFFFFFLSSSFYCYVKKSGFTNSIMNILALQPNLTWSFLKDVFKTAQLRNVWNDHYLLNGIDFCRGIFSPMRLRFLLKQFIKTPTSFFFFWECKLQFNNHMDMSTN